MIEFRRLTHDDYGDIVDISKDIWDGSDYLPKVFHKWVDDEGYFLGVLDTERNKIAGIGKLSILYDRSGWLEGLRVHKDYRGLRLARHISERLLGIAKDLLESGEIERIAFSTHITNVESSTLMKKLNFKLKAEYLIVSKTQLQLEKTLELKDFKIEEWTPSLEEFINLPYFKRRNNILPLAFIFQNPSRELYEEFLENGGFVSINDFKGITRYKDGLNFACMEESFEAIDTFMNYYLLKFNTPDEHSPVTSIMPEDKELIERLRLSGYESWAEWQPDYLYFVFEEQQTKI